MKRFLRSLSLPVALMLVFFALWVAAMYWTSRAAAEPSAAPAASDGGAGSDDPPSNEIPDFSQLG